MKLRGRLAACFITLGNTLLIGVRVRTGDGKAEPAKPIPRSRVQNATQVEPGLYVANSTTSIFQLSKGRYS